MKNFLYNNPITSSIIINTGSLAIVVKSINNDQYWCLPPLLATYVFNKKIITNGENINKVRKIALCLIYFFMISLCFLLNKYINI